MKFDRQKAFPYPVLRPHSNDYVDSEFQVTVEFKTSGDKVEGSIVYALSCDEILDHIRRGNASYFTVVTCRDTFTRETHSTSLPKVECSYKLNELRGEVLFESYVIATKEIRDYNSKYINDEFGGGPFVFCKGDVLAQEEPQAFFIDRDMFKPVTSVFELVIKESLGTGEWALDYDDDHVQIEVSKSMKEIIDEARNSRKNKIILLNSLYFSAVMQAVQKLKDSTDFNGYKWAEVIRRQAHNQDIDLETKDSFLIAQRLLKYPLFKMGTEVFKGGA